MSMTTATKEEGMKANLPAVNSRRRTLHSSPIQIWESLVYEPAVLPVARDTVDGRKMFEPLPDLFT
jgi:hypothetical protein